MVRQLSCNGHSCLPEAGDCPAMVDQLFESNFHFSCNGPNLVEVGYL